MRIVLKFRNLLGARCSAGSFAQCHVPPFHETSWDGDTLLIHHFQMFLLHSLSLRLTQTLETGLPKGELFPNCHVSGFPNHHFSRSMLVLGSVVFGLWRSSHIAALLGEHECKEAVAQSDGQT